MYLIYCVNTFNSAKFNEHANFFQNIYLNPTPPPPFDSVAPPPPFLKKFWIHTYM